MQAQVIPPRGTFALRSQQESVCPARFPGVHVEKSVTRSALRVRSQKIRTTILQRSSKPQGDLEDDLPNCRRDRREEFIAATLDAYRHFRQRIVQNDAEAISHP